MADELPDSLAAVRATFERQRTKIRRAADEAIKRIEVQRDRDIACLDRGEAGFEAGVSGKGRSSGGAAGPKRPRRTRGTTPQKAALERREAVCRYLLEKGVSVAAAEICADLNLSSHEAGTALRRLLEEGRATRTGTGRGTRYAAKVKGGQARGAALGAQIVETVGDRGTASLDELAQATGALRDEVAKVCGGLVRDGVLRMGRRDGRAVYLVARAA